MIFPAPLSPSNKVHLRGADRVADQYQLIDYCEISGFQISPNLSSDGDKNNETVRD